jgi:hypothetical protein
MNIQRLHDNNNKNNFLLFEKSGKMFDDETFPAKSSSLYWENFMSDTEMYNTYKSSVDAWKRPSELDGSSPSLWGTRGVLPNGVNQGNLGDCWFLAAAAAIAENPERIKKIFTNKDYSAEGIFELTFHKKGKPVTEVVDDRLPVKSWGSQFSPINSQKSPYGAWWLPILEKAYAKLHANYANLNGGMPAQALRDLTGMPVESF